MKYILYVMGLFFVHVATFSQSLISKDTNIKKGVLENGLSYYICHTDVNKEKVDYYLVQNVGALLEDDEQNGLAHFLEHMAFKGTKHFPGRQIRDVFEKKGLTKSINAYTGLDKTVYYMSNIPKSDMLLNDQALLICKDWCNGITMTDDAIEGERDVISNEIMQRENLVTRINKAIRPVTHNNSIHSKRFIGGTKSIIQNFERETLERLYQDWYRTDLQCVVVIGDIDIDQIETKIIRLFSDLPKKDNAKPRIDIEIADNQGVLFKEYQDKEIKETQIVIGYRHKKKQFDNALLKEEDRIKKQLINLLLEARVNNLLASKSDTIKHASLKLSSLTRLYNAYDIIVTPKKGYDKEAISLATGLNQHILENGFTKDEFEALKDRSLKALKEKKSTALVLDPNIMQELIMDNYLTGRNIITPKDEYKITKNLFKKITVGDLNNIVAGWCEKNKSIVCLNSFKRENLTKEEVLEAEKKMQKKGWYNAEVDEAAETAEMNDVKLPDVLKPGATIVREEDLGYRDVVSWTLSNGATIIYKQNDFKKGKGKFIIRAKSYGGLSLYEGDELNNAYSFNTLAKRNMFGIKGVTNDELYAFKSQNHLGYRIAILDNKEEIEGGADTQNAEQLFKLFYHLFENMTADREVYDDETSKIVEYLDTKEESWYNEIKDDLGVIMQGDRYIKMDMDSYNALSYENMVNIYQQRFTNASDFTFYIVGDISVKKAKELSQKYVGAIASNNVKEKV